MEEDLPIAAERRVEVGAVMREVGCTEDIGGLRMFSGTGVDCKLGDTPQLSWFKKA